MYEKWIRLLLEREQIDCLFEDIQIQGVKIGMVSSIEIIDTIQKCLEKNKDTIGEGYN